MESHFELDLLGDRDPLPAGILLAWHSAGNGIKRPGIRQECASRFDLEPVVRNLVGELQGNAILLLLVVLQSHGGRRVITKDFDRDWIACQVFLTRLSNI